MEKQQVNALCPYADKAAEEQTHRQLEKHGVVPQGLLPFPLGVAFHSGHDFREGIYRQVSDDDGIHQAHHHIGIAEDGELPVPQLRGNERIHQRVDAVHPRGENAGQENGPQGLEFRGPKPEPGPPPKAAVDGDPQVQDQVDNGRQGQVPQVAINGQVLLEQDQHHRQTVAAQENDLRDVVAVLALVIGGGHRQNARDALDDDGVEHHIPGNGLKVSPPGAEEGNDRLPQQVDKPRAPEDQQIEQGQKAVHRRPGLLLHIGGNDHRRHPGGQEGEEEENDVVGEVVGVHLQACPKGRGRHRGLEQGHTLGGNGQQEHQQKMPALRPEQGRLFQSVTSKYVGWGNSNIPYTLYHILVRTQEEKVSSAAGTGCLWRQGRGREVPKKGAVSNDFEKSF